jgi:hypothetical protein
MAGHMDEGKCAGLLRKWWTGLRIAEELENRLLRIRSCRGSDAQEEDT